MSSSSFQKASHDISHTCWNFILYLLHIILTSTGWCLKYFSEGFKQMPFSFFFSKNTWENCTFVSEYEYRSENEWRLLVGCLEEEKKYEMKDEWMQAAAARSCRCCRIGSFQNVVHFRLERDWLNLFYSIIDQLVFNCFEYGNSLSAAASLHTLLDFVAFNEAFKAEHSSRRVREERELCTIFVRMKRVFLPEERRRVWSLQFFKIFSALTVLPSVLRLLA